jgi:hypothetical protein
MTFPPSLEIQDSGRLGRVEEDIYRRQLCNQDGLILRVTELGGYLNIDPFQ